MKEELNKCKDILFLWKESLILVISVITKVIYRFNTIPAKILTAILRNEKYGPEIHIELQVASNIQNNIDKDEYSQRVHTFWFLNFWKKLY